MWLSSRRTLLALFASLVSNGCGYALAGRGNFLPSYIQTIGIPNFENYTSFFQMAQLVTDKIRTEFIGRGKYAVVPEAGATDATLTGEITSISVVPVGFTEQQLASRYLFTLTMRVQFTDSATSQVL